LLPHADYAVAAGLDAAAMRAAVEAGTFVIANRLAVQGAQTVDVFRGALARLGIAPR
jgi:hypothetical protein